MLHDPRHEQAAKRIAPMARRNEVRPVIVLLITIKVVNDQPPIPFGMPFDRTATPVTRVLAWADVVVEHLPVQVYLAAWRTNRVTACPAGNQNVPIHADVRRGADLDLRFRFRRSTRCDVLRSTAPSVSEPSLLAPLTCRARESGPCFTSRSIRALSTIVFDREIPDSPTLDEPCQQPSTVQRRHVRVPPLGYTFESHRCHPISLHGQSR